MTTEEGRRLYPYLNIHTYSKKEDNLFNEAAKANRIIC